MKFKSNTSSNQFQSIQHFNSDIFLRFEVAIKEALSENAKIEMLEEAKAMIRVSKHDHIVNIQGICEHNDSVYLLLEFCSLGPIDDFLRKQNSTLNNQTSIKDLIHWCSQVADGMEFLAAKNIIHVSFP